jgi:hypothetical protein
MFLPRGKLLFVVVETQKNLFNNIGDRFDSSEHGKGKRLMGHFHMDW